MSTTLTLLRKKPAAGSPFVTLVFKCVFANNYTNSGGVGNVGTPGETLAFNQALNPNFIARPKLPQGPAAKLPTQDQIRLFLPNGYDGQVEQNAVAPTPNNFVMRIFTTAATELATGAYPAGLTAEATIIEVDVPAKYR